MLQSETVRKYDTYKDSGIEWIGKIPQNWNVRKLFGLLKSIGSGTTPKGNDSYYDGDIPWLNTGDLTDSYVNIIGKTVTDIAMTECSALKLFDKNSVVIAMYGATIGKLGIITFPTTTNQACCVMSCSKSLYNKYLFYVLYSARDYILTLSYGAGQPNISQETMKSFKLCCPDVVEQQQIADYLDKKCGEIDKVVETEKSVIEKLKEYKQSIITEAVTKGLDKSIPLKDSGIEWIGKIPQHWEIIKLKKTISLIADIDHYMPDTTDTGYSYLMTGDLKDIASKIDFENCKHISDSDYKDLSKKIHPVLDDVIFARYATIGTVCYVDIQKDFLVSYSCLTIRPNSEKLFGKFLYYYLISDTFKIEVSQYINSNTQSNVGLDSLQKVYMVLPNKTEQQQIAEYLDKKCSEIDKAIADKEQIIEKFTEYKKSLIYECVTGKKRV